jgi:hypothetical protein
VQRRDEILQQFDGRAFFARGDELRDPFRISQRDSESEQCGPHRHVEVRVEDCKIRRV